jgi:ubiquinone/menaquinone biosynthesis C-methylase UbiE
MATATQCESVMVFDSLRDKNILEMGCGDGFYTFQYWDRSHPKSFTGVDAAPNAVELIRRNAGDRPMTFETGDCHKLRFEDNSFDIVLVQGVLHHDGRPWDMIREAFRIAPEVLILEPNGNSPALKVIEKVSPYHREHGERSYRSATLRRWIQEAGGTVVRERFSGFVPMFCPDWIARGMKRLEPIVEATPAVRAVCCSLYVVLGRRPG